MSEQTVLPVDGCACEALSAAVSPVAVPAVAGLPRPGSAAAPAGPGGAIVIVAYGQPKPKGSLRHVGNGRMVEQLAGSKPWRQAVKEAALSAIEIRLPGRPVAYSPPIEGPVAVEITTTVAKPKSAPKRRETWPVTRSSGDADKHARNVLDALTDASVVLDDSQVVELVCRKRYSGQHPDTLDRPGAVIRVWRIGGAPC